MREAQFLLQPERRPSLATSAGKFALARERQTADPDVVHVVSSAVAKGRREYEKAEIFVADGRLPTFFLI